MIFIQDSLYDKLKGVSLSSLHVVSDFDRTLTKCFVNGKKIPSTIALIREGGYLTDDYPRKAFTLFDTYHPIEVDDSLDFEYKYLKMKEWWEEHERLLVASGMCRAVVDDIISKYPKMFRDGSLEFLKLLYEKEIPILIFSSGNGNIIEGALEKENALFSNIHILSNTFNFDSDGKATGYKNEVIHILNKSETAIEDKYKMLISNRPHVLLLGDSLGDLGMVDSLHSSIIIKIGFLNEHPEKLELYKSKFDIVITEDGSMDEVLSLFNRIK